MDARRAGTDVLTVACSHYAVPVSRHISFPISEPMDACRHNSENIYIHQLARLFRQSLPLHDHQFPDKSQLILSTRSQLRYSPTRARQGRQTRLGALDLDRGVFWAGS
jgi:hypothetical protein